jgi:hypothetical protein
MPDLPSLASLHRQDREPPRGDGMSRVDYILDRLDKVRKTGQSTYLACCPAHEDRTASLSIREKDDGGVLIHCFAGCTVHEIVASVGLDIADLFPPRVDGHSGNPDRRPFPATDALRAVAFEALVVSAAASAMLAGHPFSAVDRERLSVAASRINAALGAAIPSFRGARHERH